MDISLSLSIGLASTPGEYQAPYVPIPLNTYSPTVVPLVEKETKSGFSLKIPSTLGGLQDITKIQEVYEAVLTRVAFHAEEAGFHVGKYTLTANDAGVWHVVDVRPKWKRDQSADTPKWVFLTKVSAPSLYCACYDEHTDVLSAVTAFTNGQPSSKVSEFVSFMPSWAQYSVMSSVIIKGCFDSSDGTWWMSLWWENYDFDGAGNSPIVIPLHLSDMVAGVVMRPDEGSMSKPGSFPSYGIYHMQDGVRPPWYWGTDVSALPPTWVKMPDGITANSAYLSTVASFSGLDVGNHSVTPSSVDHPAYRGRTVSQLWVIPDGNVQGASPVAREILGVKIGSPSIPNAESVGDWMALNSVLPVGLLTVDGSPTDFSNYWLIPAQSYLVRPPKAGFVEDLRFKDR